MMIDWNNYVFVVGPLLHWGGGSEAAEVATVADAYCDYVVATGPGHFVVATQPCHYVAEED